MSDAEKAIVDGIAGEAKAAVKALLKDLVDKELPALLAAESARLPLSMQPFVMAALAAGEPVMLKALDQLIDKI